MDPVQRQRLHRVIATNKVMERHGLKPLELPASLLALSDFEPLPVAATTTEQKEHKEEEEFLASLDEGEKTAMKGLGIGWEEYAAIRATDHYKNKPLLGLKIHRPLYFRLLQKCNSKQAMALSNDRQKSRLYLEEKIKALAQKEAMKRSIEKALGLSTSMINQAPSAQGL